MIENETEVNTETGEVTGEIDPEREIELIINAICPSDRDRAYALVAVARRPKKRRKKLLAPDGEVWIPLKKLFGTTKVPEAVADVIEEAVKTMIAAGDISEINKFQFLEYVSAEYIAENGVQQDG